MRGDSGGDAVVLLCAALALYEWLGVVAPLALLWWFRALAQRGRQAVLARVSRGWCILAYFSCGGVGYVAAIPLERLRPLEPMRFLHLVYLLFVLLSGGLLGQYVLKKHALRWLLLFVPLSAGCFMRSGRCIGDSAFGTARCDFGQRLVEAFRWISRNTPVDGEFALDPHYMELPGEDYHGFRALAERSVLADGVRTREWWRECEACSALAARSGRATRMARFSACGLLAPESGVRRDWVVLAAPAWRDCRALTGIRSDGLPGGVVGRWNSEA